MGGVSPSNEITPVGSGTQWGTIVPPMKSKNSKNIVFYSIPFFGTQWGTIVPPMKSKNPIFWNEMGGGSATNKVKKSHFLEQGGAR